MTWGDELRSGPSSGLGGRVPRLLLREAHRTCHGRRQPDTTAEGERVRANNHQAEGPEVVMYWRPGGPEQTPRNPRGLRRWFGHG